MSVAADNPATNSDPSGLHACSSGDGSACDYAPPPDDGGGPTDSSVYNQSNGTGYGATTTIGSATITAPSQQALAAAMQAAYQRSLASMGYPTGPGQGGHGAPLQCIGVFNTYCGVGMQAELAVYANWVCQARGISCTGLDVLSMAGATLQMAGGMILGRDLGAGDPGGPFVSLKAADLKAGELDTANLLMADPTYKGGQLRAYRVPGSGPGDFIDQSGKTYDAIGTRDAYQNWNAGKFTDALYRHLYLKGTDYTALNLTGATSDQVGTIFAAMDSWEATYGPPASPAFILGGGY